MNTELDKMPTDYADLLEQVVARQFKVQHIRAAVRESDSQILDVQMVLRSDHGAWTYEISYSRDFLDDLPRNEPAKAFVCASITRAYARLSTIQSAKTLGKL